MAQPKNTLLFIDDDEPSISFAKRDLGKDWKVIGCHTLGESFAVLKQLDERKDPISVVLIDWNIPARVGNKYFSREKLSELFKSRGPKVGFISGYLSDDVRRYAELRCLLLFKRSEYTDFIEVVNSILKGRAGGKERLG